LSASAPGPEDLPRKIEEIDARPAPSGSVLERSKRMQTLPPHIRGIEDEFFLQSYLRKKRFDI
jgi:hypothetical protein